MNKKHKKNRKTPAIAARPAAAAPAGPLGPTLRRITVPIDPVLHARLQAACALRKTTLAAEVRRVLRKAVRRATKRWPHLADVVARGSGT